MGDHQATLTIQLQPAFVLEAAKHPGHGDAGGTQGTGQLLVGELDIQAQALVAGLAVIIGEQFEKAAYPIFDAAQTKQTQHGLALAVAHAHALEQGHGQVGGGGDFIAGEAEQVALTQGGGLVDLHVGEGIAEGFIRTCQTQQELITLHRDGAQLDHATHHQPDTLFEQGHPASRRQMHQTALLVAGLQQLNKAGSLA